MGMYDDSPTDYQEFEENLSRDEEGGLMNPDENYDEYVENHHYTQTNAYEDHEITTRPKKRLIKPDSEEFHDEAPPAGFGDYSENHHQKSRGDHRLGRLKVRNSDYGTDVYPNDRQVWKGENRPGYSEDERVEPRNFADDKFIDDSGLHSYDAVHSDDEERRMINDAPQAEEETNELDKFFKKGKKRKSGHSHEDIAIIVEDFIYKMHMVAEEDAEANRNRQPAIGKLKMLSEVKDILSKKHLQNEFLDRGILTTLKNWLEPLPDGSLPNILIRNSILSLLAELPLDVGVYERRELLKQSGLGRSIMFLSKLPEETPQNQKLARTLIETWSRPIFQKSTRYEDLRQYDDDKPLPRRHKNRDEDAVRSSAPKADDDLEFETRSLEPKPGEKGFRLHASRPQPMALDFVVRPLSKISPDEMQKSKAPKDVTKHGRINKKLQKLANAKRRNTKVHKLSVEGRGLISYL